MHDEDDHDPPPTSGRDQASPDSVLARLGEVIGARPAVTLRGPDGKTPPTPDGSATAGKYVVGQELGRGGVGAVHSARDTDLGREVAMKFLHEHFRDEPTLLHRFVEEAQIGGQLQHPGIVPVYDLGMSDGRPFFAMKLVRGETLAALLGKRAAHTSDRARFLDIFESICQTVAYAHARGVVHRDLKPANVMIGRFGEVQVVDWGMGKVLDQPAGEGADAGADRDGSIVSTVRSTGDTSQSMMGSVMGTPAYMPPEQARGDVTSMDERSDVFCLGGILCEILTGAPTYTGAPDELIAKAAMAKLDDANKRLAECGADPELIELAQRCLLPAPAARPRSAEEVAAIVHEYLASVQARADEARVAAASAKVRARLGGLLAIAVAAGLAVSLWFWRDAAQSADTAERELARAVEMKQLLSDMLGGVTPEKARAADTALLVSLLDDAAGRLAGGEVDEQVAADLQVVIGNVYASVAEHTKAEPHIEAALATLRRLHGATASEVLPALSALAILRNAQGRLADAEARAREALAIAESQLEPDHENVLSLRSNLAHYVYQQGRLDEAEPLFVDALARQRDALGESNPNTRATMLNLGQLYRQRGRTDDAERLLLRVLTLEQEQLGDDSPRAAVAANTLADLYLSNDRLQEAQTYLEQALAVQRSVLADDHPDTLQTLGNLAKLYGRMGRVEQSAEAFRSVLTALEATLGDHPDTAAATANLGAALFNKGERDEGAELFERALDMFRRTGGESHPQIANCLMNLARWHLTKGQPKQAVPLLEDAVRVRAQDLGPTTDDTLATKLLLAQALGMSRRFQDAQALIEQELEALRAARPDDRAPRVRANLALAELHSRQRRIDLAEPIVLQAVAEMREGDVALDPSGAQLFAMVANVQYADGRGDEAIELLRLATPVLERAFGAGNLATTRARTTLGGALLAGEQFAEAEQCFRSLVATYAEQDAQSATFAAMLNNLGTAMLKQQRYSEAAEQFERSVAILREKLGVRHSWTQNALLGLADARDGQGRREEAVALFRELYDAQAKAAERRTAKPAEKDALARTLLTHPLEEVRDPGRALQLATAACAAAEERGDPSTPWLLDTLALAQHATGASSDAAATQRRALQLLPEDAPATDRAAMQTRLDDYQAASQKL